jgi:hypothetical protein
LVSAPDPNSAVLVLPTTIAPAARSRATCVESCAATASLKSREPWPVGRPATFSRSLTPSGTPSSGRASRRIGSTPVTRVRREQLVGVTATAHCMQDRFAAIERRDRELHQLDRRNRSGVQGAA